MHLFNVLFSLKTTVDSENKINSVIESGFLIYYFVIYEILKKMYVINN